MNDVRAQLVRVVGWERLRNFRPPALEAAFQQFEAHSEVEQPAADVLGREVRIEVATELGRVP